jgi:phospholipid-binding lipoprotein MlaA
LDRQGNLVNYIGDENLRTGLTVLNYVDDRAMYLKVTDVMEGAALDAYSFTRDAYLQRQRYRQFNGSPPQELDVKP